MLQFGPDGSCTQRSARRTMVTPAPRTHHLQGKIMRSTSIAAIRTTSLPPSLCRRRWIGEIWAHGPAQTGAISIDTRDGLT